MHLSTTNVALLVQGPFTMLCKGCAEDHILAANLPVFMTYVPTQSVAIIDISADPSSRQVGIHDTTHKLCNLACLPSRVQMAVLSASASQRVHSEII